MTPRMLHQAQAQETAYQYGLEENKTKIDYSLVLLASGSTGQFVTGVKSPILERFSRRLSVCLWRMWHKCHIAAARLQMPVHSIVETPVRGGAM